MSTSAEASLYALLSGYAPLVALVASAIYPDMIPQGVQLPAVVFGRTGSEPVVTIHGAAAGEFVDLSVECWAPTRAQAMHIADAVIAALLAAGEMPTNHGAGLDDLTGAYSGQVDVRMFST